MNRHWEQESTLHVIRNQKIAERGVAKDDVPGPVGDSMSSAQVPPVPAPVAAPVGDGPALDHMIGVKTATGAQYVVNYSSSHTVAEFKHQLRVQNGLPDGTIVFFLGGRPLVSMFV